MPVGWVVAGLALVSAAAIMRIVGFVATEAGRWRFGKRLIVVAVEACCLLMFAEQRIVRRIVIELSICPFG